MTEDIGPCEEWPQAKSKNGYGVTWRNGKTVSAHRTRYTEAFGPIPAGLVVRHRCDNPACVRLDHLELGTHADNTRDMVLRGRARGGAPRRYPPIFDRLVRRMVETQGWSMNSVSKRLGISVKSVQRMLGLRRTR